MPAVAEVWRRGSVIASWLLDLTAAALVESPDLADFSGRVSDSGEGRWTRGRRRRRGRPGERAERVAVQPLQLARRGRVYGDKLLSAMRKQFGGHAEKPSAGV